MSLLGTLLSRPMNTEITTSEGLDAFLRKSASVWSGMSVTSKNAVEVAAVMAAVRVIAEDIGKLPAIVYRDLPEDRRERARNTRSWDLVHNRPNRWMSSQAFRETMTAWALLRGNGIALKNPGQDGATRELLPIHPDRVRFEQTSDWELIYWITGADNVERPFTRRQVFHVPGLSLDGVVGTGIVSLARQTIGISMAAQRHSGSFFANGLQTSGVFTHPGQLSDAAYERLKESLKEGFTAEEVYSPMILEESMNWVQTGLTNQDSQFLESRQFEVTEIARWFRVAPHKIANLDRATFSNIEHQSIEHITDTLMPWAQRWEYAWTHQLLPNGLFVELLFDALLRGTTLERYRAYSIAAGGNAPWMSRNEIRRRENLDPIDGLDEMLTPLNMGGDDQESGDDASFDADTGPVSAIIRQNGATVGATETPE